MPLEYKTIHYTELPPARLDEPQGVEWEFYRREVGRLLAEGHEGRWILIKGEEIIGFYDDRDSASAEASKRYYISREPCLIHQIQTRERLHFCAWMWRPDHATLHAALDQ